MPPLIESGKSALALAEVSKGFSDGRRRASVLAGFSLELMPGETVAICGPSGAGKSTLLNLVSGLLPVDSGQLWLRDGDVSHPMHRLDEAARTALRRRLVGYVFQFFNLVPTLSLLENVRLPLVLNKREDLLPKARQRLESLGLGSALHRFPDSLSGGERQRVAIARALAHEPAILLADEPTGNLDTQASEQVADMLWAEVERLNCAMLIATHSPALAQRAQRIVELG